MKYEFHEKVDSFKHNWHLFACTRHNDDGTETKGSVQADSDGDLIAEETFEEN